MSFKQKLCFFNICAIASQNIRGKKVRDICMYGEIKGN